MSAPKQNKPVSYLKSNIEKFKEKAAGSNLSEIQGWLETGGVVEKLHKNLKKEQEVYTLLSPEKSKMVSSFFYSPKVYDSNKSEIDLSELIRLNDREGVLINGRLGQGKSVLLRYLQFLELNSGGTVPIFLELRKIKQATQVVESACEKLNMMGLPCSNKLFNFLLSEGYVSLFLDGFDEISLEHREAFSSSISEICKKHPTTKLVLTSRFNTEVYWNTDFTKYSIAELEESDVAPFVKTILSSEKNYAPILSKIKESKDFDYEVLDTPLMITWFIVVYNKRFKIPKAKLGFYEDLFLAILSRHDGFKDSYNRPSKTKLADDEIKSVFCALCYITRKDQKRLFSEDEIVDYIRRSLNISGFKSIRAEDYLHDLTNVTCLLKKDGIDYEFIHETVVQYFSSLFIKVQTEDNAAEFYSNRVVDWEKFDGELGFLVSIDKVRYNKYFFIPSVRRLLRDDGYVKKSVVEKMFSSSLIATRQTTDRSAFIQGTIVVVFLSGSNVEKPLVDQEVFLFLEDKIGGVVREELDASERNVSKLKGIYSGDDGKTLNTLWYSQFENFLSIEGMRDKVLSHAVEVLSPYYQKKLKAAEEIVVAERSKEGLFT